MDSAKTIARTRERQDSYLKIATKPFLRHNRSDMRLLLIDNYDSFTYNLVQYFGDLDVDVIVRRNDEISIQEAATMQPDFLVFSPGPGTVEHPKDIGMGPELFQHFRGKTPILGVCLGHQMIAHLLGGKIEKAEPVHGKSWPIKVLSQSGIFENFPDTFNAMRYHSMVVSRENFPKELKITAETDDDQNLVMAFEKADERIYGVQFHPESIGTKSGMEMLKNFLNTHRLPPQ